MLFCIPFLGVYGSICASTERHSRQLILLLTKTVASFVRGNASGLPRHVRWLPDARGPDAPIRLGVVGQRGRALPALLPLPGANAPRNAPAHRSPARSEARSERTGCARRVGFRWSPGY